nr:unnamed protein product [Callosobruchus analis]
MDNVNAEGIIVDKAIPLRHNVYKTEGQKIAKYHNRSCELQRMWKLKQVKIIPLVIVTDGLVSNNLHNNIKKSGLPAYLIALCRRQHYFRPRT